MRIATFLMLPDVIHSFVGYHGHICAGFEDVVNNHTSSLFHSGEVYPFLVE